MHTVHTPESEYFPAGHAAGSAGHGVVIVVISLLMTHIPHMSHNVVYGVGPNIELGSILPIHPSY